MEVRISLASISTGSRWGVPCLQRRALQGQQLWLQLRPECPSYCWRCNFVAVLSALLPELQPMLPRRLEVRAPGLLGRRNLQVARTHALPCELQPLLPRRAKQRHGAGYEPADVDRARELQRHRNAFLQPDYCTRGYGATAARLTPDQKVGSSNLSGLNFHWQLLGRVLSAAARPARPAALAPAEVRVPQLLLPLQLCGSSPCIAA